MSSSNNDSAQEPLSLENSAGDQANRRLAMVCLAAFTLLFSLMMLLLQQTPTRTKEDISNPPKFVTQIPDASNEEWMLLPGVGEKTASRWRADLNSQGTERVRSVDLHLSSESDPHLGAVPGIDSLEDLHGVGPTRAKKLEPYISNVAVESPTKKPSKKRAPKSPKSSASIQSKSNEISSPRLSTSSNLDNSEEKSTEDRVEQPHE